MQKSKKMTAIFLCMLLMFQMNLTALADTTADDSYEDITIITQEDADSDPVVITTKEPTPQAILSLSDMTLSNMPVNAKYSVDNGLGWTSSSGRTESLDAISNQLAPGGTILIYQPGVDGKTLDSDQQKITMGKATRPSGFQVTNITTSGGTGSISGISNKMEFSYDQGTNWERTSSTTVVGLEPGDYYIRVANYGTDFASDPAIVTVEEDIPTPHEKEPTPSSSFDARTLTLYDVPYHGSYAINSTSNWISASGSVEIRNAGPGDDILVKALGNGVDTEDSDIQTIHLGQQSLPSGVTPIPATASTGLGGLDHVNSTMEYCVHNTNSWHSISGNTVTGLIPGNYDIRTIASGARFASDSIQITVPIATKKIKEPTPNGTFDAPSMTMYGVSVGMAYSYDGGHSFTTIRDNRCTKVSLSNDNSASAIAHNGIQLKMLGNDVTTIDSDIQTISISKASPPKDLSTKPTTNDAGAIYHVNSSMEYARENGGWNSITSDTVSNLKYGKYFVRFKANGSALASDSVTVEIAHKTSKVKEATPTADFNARIMTLSNIRGVKYSLDGGDNWNYYTDRDKIVLPESSLRLSKGIKLYRPGSNNSTDSDVQMINLSKADPPTTLSVINATASSLGIINGVNDCMEYTTMNGTTWTEIYGNTLTNLQPATYLIRVHGKYNVLPSDPVGVVVAMDTGNAGTTGKPASKGTSTTTKPSGTQTDQSSSASTPETPDTSDTSTSSITAEDELKDISNEPVLVSDSSITGWDNITQNIVPGKPILISLHQNEAIPASLLMAAKESNSDIVIGMDNHIQWSITASSIEDISDDINLGITDSAVSIPDNLISAANKLGTVTREFDVAYDGYFGFSAYLTLPVKSGTTNQYANLLYYNPLSQDLELVSSCDIDDSGYASFEMRHASSYLVVISSAPITSLETKAQDENRSTTVTTAATSNKVTVILIICVVVMITIILINLVLLIIGRATHRKRRRK